MISNTKFGWALAAAFALVGFFGAVELTQASVNSETQHAATQTGASDVGEISFSKESSELSTGAKNQLEAIITEANKKGPVTNVKVAAWADQEYPAKGVSLAGSQVSLAEKRAEAVQAYLENSLKVTGVSTVNMAERPSGFQEILKTPGAKTKNALEKSGAAPTNSSQTGLFGLKGKATYAVIMIYHKK